MMIAMCGLKTAAESIGVLYQCFDVNNMVSVSGGRLIADSIIHAPDMRGENHRLSFCGAAEKEQSSFRVIIYSDLQEEKNTHFSKLEP